jgi:hypothetical protein
MDNNSKKLTLTTFLPGFAGKELLPGREIFGTYYFFRKDPVSKKDIKKILSFLSSTEEKK